MCLHVIDGDQGLLQGPGEGLGGGDADEQGADQTGAIRDGDCVEVG
jgi:hypothetical protein